MPPVLLFYRPFTRRPPKIVTDGKTPTAGRPSSSASKCLLCGGLLLCLFYGGHHALVLPRPEIAEESPQDAPALNIEESPPSENRCWVFNHLQKAGGTTVKRLLFDLWGSESTTYDSYQWKKGQGYADSVAASLASPAGWSAAGGGYLEALRFTPAFQPDDKRTPCRWFTVFRHPVSRLVSAYYYCRQGWRCWPWTGFGRIGAQIYASWPDSRFLVCVCILISPSQFSEGVSSRPNVGCSRVCFVCVG